MKGLKISRWYLGIIYLVPAVLLITPLVVSNEYVWNLLIIIYFNAVLALGWNFVGSCGQFSFGNSAFLGIGAYTSTLLFVRLGISPWLGLIVGVGFAVLASSFVGLTTLRLTGPFFIMGTYAFAEILMWIFINLSDLTGGPRGLFIPLGDSPINFQFTSRLPFYYSMLILMLFSIYVSRRVFRSRIGYSIRAIADDQTAAESLGVHALRYKLTAFAISSCFAALAGSFYAQYMLYIEPYEIFGFNNSFKPLVFATVGGLGTTIGPVLGCFVLISAEELMRATMAELVGPTFGILDTLILGAVFILVILLRPDGIVPKLGRRSGTAAHASGEAMSHASQNTLQCSETLLVTLRSGNISRLYVS